MTHASRRADSDPLPMSGSPPPLLGPLRVLIVGEASTARDFVDELKSGGYDPAATRVEDRSALDQALETGQWDIALCEDALAGLDGSSILRLIKRIRPALPVIVVSRVFGESIARAAMKAGADDFIARGYLARLCAAVERGVRSARLRQVWEEAARSLSDAEARNDAFMNNSPAVAFMKDERGRLVYANRTFETVFRVKVENLLGKTDAEWLPPATAAEVSANDARVLATGRTMQFEESVPAPDGRPPLARLQVSFPRRERAHLRGRRRPGHHRAQGDGRGPAALRGPLPGPGSSTATSSSACTTSRAG